MNHRLTCLLLLFFMIGCPCLRAGNPREAYEPLRLGEIQPRGWLRAQLERDLKSGFQGHFDLLLRHRRTGEYLLQPEHNDYVTREKNRNSRHDNRGLTIPAAPQAWWNAEMIGDWQDSLVRAAFLVGDEQAKAKTERFIADLLKAQEADGYLGIYPRGYRFHFASADGELWTQRCALLPMLAYYEFTGRAEVLAAVEKAVKLTISQYGPDKNYFDNPKQPNSGVSHGLLFVDVLEWLYRLTADDQYRQAAVYLYDSYSKSSLVANKAAQLPKLLDERIPLGGHGPDIMGFLRVPLLTYYLTGNLDYQRAWNNSIVKLSRHLGVGGSPLSGHHEEIIPEGQTPDSPYEYCSTFYLLHSLTWAIQKAGEPRYSDMLENTLFNAVQGARFPDGKALTYYSADERLWVRQKPPEGTGNDRYIYTAAYYPSCCHNSGARSYPYATAAMWMRSNGRDGEGLVATIYGPAQVSTKVSGVPVTVLEETGYPFAYEIEITINPERELAFPLRLSVPEWSQGYQLKAGGAKVRKDEQGFLVLERTWKPGSKVRLVLKPRIQGRPAVNGTTAVTYGPLVFSVPVPEQAEIVQRFPDAEAAGLRGFYGYQYDPADLKAAKRPLKLRLDRPDLGLAVVRDKQASSLYPWDRSPIRLEGGMLGAGGKPERVAFLPMGCTILRRTCF